jgi:hypothetical protein
LATEREVLAEQKRTIERADVPTYYMGIHIINSLSFDAELPRDKEAAIARIDRALANTDNEILGTVPERHSI